MNERTNIVSSVVKIDTRAKSLMPVEAGLLFRAFARREGKIVLLYGDPQVFRLSLFMASTLLCDGSTIAVVDGCNRFDVHAITQFARRRRKIPEDLLNRIFVSRSFTCYQLEASITERLPAFLGARRAHTALIFGLVDTMYDQQVPLATARQILLRILRTLHALKAKGTAVLLTCADYNVVPKERNTLMDQLKRSADFLYYFALEKRSKPQLFHETLVRKEH